MTDIESPVPEEASSASTETSPEPEAPRRDLVDLVLNAALIALLVGVLVVGGLLGWDWWSYRQRLRETVPQGKLLDTLAAQLKADPNNIGVRIRYAEVLGSAGMVAPAVRQLNEALKLDPKHVGAHVDLGILALQSSKQDEAAGYFTKVLELTAGDYQTINPARETAYYYLGEIAISQGRFEDAIANLKAAARVKRTSSDTYYALGRAYQGLGETDAAIENFERALLFDPNYAPAHYLLGQIYVEKGDMVNAALRLKAAADLSPGADPPAEALASLGTAQEWYRKAQTYFADKELDKALDAVLVSTILDDKNADAAFLHARIVEARGDKKSALNIYKKMRSIVTSGTADATRVAGEITRLSGKK